MTKNNVSSAELPPTEVRDDRTERPERMDYVNHDLGSRRTNKVRIGADVAELPILPLNNNIDKFILSAEDQLIKNEGKQKAAEIAEHLHDLSPEEILALAKKATEHTKSELLEMPAFVTFLQKNKNYLQEVDMSGGINTAGQSRDVEDYLVGLGVPSGAEHYFITTIKNREELTNMMNTNRAVSEQYTVRYFYSSDVAGPKRELGFQLLQKDHPTMVFIFAEDVSTHKNEQDNVLDSNAHDKKPTTDTAETETNKQAA